MFQMGGEKPPTSDAGWLKDFQDGCIKNINYLFLLVAMVLGKSKSSMWGGFLKISLSCLTYKKLLAGGNWISNLTCTYFSNWVLEKNKKHQRPAAFLPRKPMDFSQAVQAIHCFYSPSLAAFFFDGFVGFSRWLFKFVLFRILFGKKQSAVIRESFLREEDRVYNEDSMSHEKTLLLFIILVV